MTKMTRRRALSVLAAPAAMAATAPVANRPVSSLDRVLSRESPSRPGRTSWTA